jgi:hypothetical protein
MVPMTVQSASMAVSTPTGRRIASETVTVGVDAGKALINGALVLQDFSLVAGVQ